MLDLLRVTIEQNADATWRVSTSWSAAGCCARVDIGGVTFRAAGPTVESAETQVAAQIVEWAECRQLAPEPGDDLLAQLEASIAIERAKRGRRQLRVIKGGKS